jgi:hypothetical protein
VGVAHAGQVASGHTKANLSVALCTKRILYTDGRRHSTAGRIGTCGKRAFQGLVLRTAADGRDKRVAHVWTGYDVHR